MKTGQDTWKKSDEIPAGHTLHKTRRAGHAPALPEPKHYHNNMNGQGIIVPQGRKNRRKSQNIFTWIRERTSPFCFGVKSRAGHPVHCNKNADVLAQFRSFRLKLGSWYLSRLSNADMATHCDGRRTFYFTADGRCRTNEVLINAREG